MSWTSFAHGPADGISLKPSGFAIWWWLLALPFASALAQDVPSSEGKAIREAKLEFRFASRDEARATLQQHDSFIQSLSPFDRMARMRTTNDPGTPAFLEFVANEAREWTPSERTAIGNATELLGERLRELRLPLSGQITLVHTTGKEESGAAYTRGRSIVLPQGKTGSLDRPPLRLIAHELFHVLSRSNPEMRDRLYAIIGFHPVGVIRLPDDLAARQITNPDAPQIEHAIDVQVSNTKAAKLAPVLLASRNYAPEEPSLFRYLDFKLLELRRDESEGWVPQLVDGEPVLHDPSLPDFHRQIGSNTSYIIHPDEVLADNFALLISGEEVQDRWIVDKMQEILSARPPAAE